MKSPKLGKMISSMNGGKKLNDCHLSSVHCIGKILTDTGGGRGVIGNTRSPLQVCSVNDG